MNVSILQTMSLLFYFSAIVKHGILLNANSVQIWYRRENFGPWIVLCLWFKFQMVPVYCFQHQIASYYSYYPCKTATQCIMYKWALTCMCFCLLQFATYKWAASAIALTLLCQHGNAVWCHYLLWILQSQHFCGCCHLPQVGLCVVLSSNWNGFTIFQS